MERALKICTEAHGPDHPEVAKAQTNLGNAYGTVGNFSKKRELLEQALAIKEMSYGHSHSEVAPTLVSLGNACGGLGDTEKMLEHLDRARVIQEASHGVDHWDLAITYTCLATAYAATHSKTLAEDVSEKASRITGMCFTYPSSVRSEVRLRLAVAAFANGREASVTAADCEQCFSEFRAALGVESAQRKMASLLQLCQAFWRCIDRADVADWLVQRGEVLGLQASTFPCHDLIK